MGIVIPLYTIIEEHNYRLFERLFLLGIHL